MKLPITDNLQKIFDVLDNDRTWLQIRWQMYKQLYASGPRRLELLNDSGSNFFVDLRRILIDDMIVGTCRMIDPAHTRHRRNATLDDLIHAVADEGINDLATELKKHLRTIESKSKPLRAHRNKRISHRDRETALEPEKRPLPGVTVETIDSVLDEIGKFLNTFQLNFGDSSTIYDWVNVSHGADTMIERLKEGAVFDQMLRDDPITWYPKKEQGPFHDA